jgi:hypothetical protein
MFVDLITD